MTVDLGDTSLADLDDVGRARMAERSLRQMIRAGFRFAMLPGRLVDLDGLGTTPLAGATCLCSTGDAVILWACLLDADHDAGHGWPPPTERDRMAAALLEQVDPVARVNRRWAHALAELEPGEDAGDALADFLDDLAGMPPA